MSFHKPLLVILLLALVLLVVPVGATVSTFYTTNTSDGALFRGADNTTLTDIYTGVGTSGDYGYNSVYLYPDRDTDKWWKAGRGVLIFDTSALDDSASISDAAVCFQRSQLYTTLGTDTNITITGFTIDGGINSADYDNFNNVVYSNTKNVTALSSGVYHCWNLTAPGIANISKTGNTGFGIMLGFDLFGQVPTWASNNRDKIEGFSFRHAELVTDIPYLDVTYTTDTAPPASLSNLQNTTANCGQIIFRFTKPADADYGGAQIWLNDVAQTNLTASDTFVEFTKLGTGDYTLGTKTFDTEYHSNESFANHTVTVSTACPGPMGALANNDTVLTVSTYDGSGQNVHPYLLYVPDGWNGWHYLLATTPYPGGNDAFETPAMRYSNNMFDWYQIPGQPDPIIPNGTGVGNDFCRDPFLALKDDRLYLWYDCPDNPAGNYFIMTNTTDGVTWTESVNTDLIGSGGSANWNGTVFELFNKPISTWYRYISTNGINWTEDSSFTAFDMGSSSAAHFEVKRYDDQYMTLVASTDRTELRFFNSTDGLNATNQITWSPSGTIPVLANRSHGNWDEQLYKSTFFELNGTYYVIYGAYALSPTSFNLAYTSYPAGETPPDYTAAPVASFSTNVTSGTVPLAVSFTDTSTNVPTSWNWSFGDGNFSETQNPEHVYNYTGLFTVSLITTNGAGSDTETKDDYITVTGPEVRLQCQNQTGNITINLFSNSTSTLGWNWQDPGNITKIAEDGLYVLSFDNSSDYYIGTGYLPESWHKLKIYNQTDFGQLNCTTDAVPVTPTPIPIMPSTESNANLSGLFAYWWVVAGGLIAAMLVFGK